MLRSLTSSSKCSSLSNKAIEESNWWRILILLLMFLIRF
ncbi:hypothetical protein C5167_048344 [Papaver somniferum]|uniref:Uncharacterized protein n=1 Tax=Papaver somniferum TaxID=3469 RepID=A0A4Y7KHP6_PAPSO|nr:hypothetical protein C5167_048344 [Papaver somniferum]